MTGSSAAEPWHVWIGRWEWLRDCVRAKGCRDFEIKVSPPLPRERVEEFEHETGLKLPSDFVKTVTQFARAVEFDWELYFRMEHRILREDDPRVVAQLEAARRSLGEKEFNENREALLKEYRKRDPWLKPPGHIGPAFGGTGAEAMWLPTESIVDRHRGFQEEIEGQVNDYQPEDYDSATHRGYLPIFRLEDGDAVVMDLARNPAPILHLGHEGGFLPESTTRIGEDFASFMTRWSAIGCPPPHSYELEKFMDANGNQIDPDGAASKVWIAWLEGRDERVGQSRDAAPTSEKPRKGWLRKLFG